jgi:uroporphyrinogen decarboxylase
MPREALSSRERVVRTLNRQPVDRYPIDLGSHLSTGISAFAYRNLRRHLGLSTGSIRVPDLVQMLAYVDEDILERFHVDCILLEPRWRKSWRWRVRDDFEFEVPTTFRPTQDQEGGWITCQGREEMRMPAGGYFSDGAWLSNWGGLGEDDAIELYAREAERIYKETPYATNFVGYSYGGGFEAFFGGIERCIAMMEDPGGILTEHEALLEQYLLRAGKIIDRFGQYIQLITISDDMGTQDRPMCRPRLIEEFSAPFIRRFCDFIHRNSDIKVFMHNCGSIRPLIPILIDCGVDVLNPVQISAENMEPSGLKEEFGDRIIFWGGGCDTQNVLGAARPEEVCRNVKALTAIFKPGGGFVFNQVHNIMGDVPPANIVAMLETAYQESFYESASLDCVPIRRMT